RAPRVRAPATTVRDGPCRVCGRGLGDLGDDPDRGPGGPRTTVPGIRPRARAGRGGEARLVQGPAVPHVRPQARVVEFGQDGQGRPEEVRRDGQAAAGPATGAPMTPTPERLDELNAAVEQAAKGCDARGVAAGWRAVLDYFNEVSAARP